jgi:hypothetical protein
MALAACVARREISRVAKSQLNFPAKLGFLCECRHKKNTTFNIIISKRQIRITNSDPVFNNLLRKLLHFSFIFPY